MKFDIELLELDNFIHDSYCDYIVNAYGNNLEEAGVLDENNPDGGYSSVQTWARIANQTWIRRTDDLVINKIKSKLSEIINLPVENQESPQFLYYNPGGKYDAHYDAFDSEESSLSMASHRKRGGQRVHTALLYLNEGCVGGETEFPLLNYKVTPKKGKMIIWKNCDENFEKLNNSLHAGLPVISGTKICMVIWIRQNKFGIG